MKAQTKILTFRSARYVNMDVHYRRLRICDKYQNPVCWPILLRLLNGTTKFTEGPRVRASQASLRCGP